MGYQERNRFLSNNEREKLSLKELTLKLTVHLALTSATRASEIH